MAPEAGTCRRRLTAADMADGSLSAFPAAIMDDRRSLPIAMPHP
jgi:hypothetical protein